VTRAVARAATDSHESLAMSAHGAAGGVGTDSHESLAMSAHGAARA
jgi:hypothetical protein